MEKEVLRWLAVADRYKRMYLDKQLGPLGINSSQHMYVLKVCAEPGITQDQFLQSFYVHPSNVTRAVAALEKGGFLRREACEEDKRKWRLYPTDHSRNLYPEIVRICRETEDILQEGFSGEERKLFRTLLKRAGKNMLDCVSLQGGRPEEIIREKGKV